MNKSFEQWLFENRRRYPTVWRKVEKMKRQDEWAKREKNKRAMWEHGVRTQGPPSW